LLAIFFMTITVRAAEPSDYEAVRETMAQPRAQAQTLQLPLPSAEMWKKRLTEIPAGDHMLVAEINRKVVGNLGLHAASKAPRRRHVASLGMAVHDDYHNRGVGGALMKAALDLADNWLQYTRIELTVYTDNEPAIALYKKFEFETEGTLKQYAFRNGVMVDAYAMARLKK
jgi:L-phenylalanine/L-methionine N-acetyltransferase